MTRLIVALALLIIGSDQAPRPRPVRWVSAAMFIACLALVGCAAPDTVRLEPGDTVSAHGLEAEDAGAVAAAVAEWNTAVPALGLVYSDAGRWEVEYADLPGRSTGAFDPDRREIQLDPEASPSVVFRTTLHEMGHALGFLGHLESGLMREKFTAKCIDAAALAAVCEARPELCDGRERTTCEE